MTSVTYEVAPGRAIVFVADVPEYGPAEVRTSRRGIFSCRVVDRRAREAALRAVEAFADEHASELEPHYEEIAKAWSTVRVA